MKKKYECRDCGYANKIVSNYPGKLLCLSKKIHIPENRKKLCASFYKSEPILNLRHIA
jgi:hypothetical protein